MSTRAAESGNGPTATNSSDPAAPIAAWRSAADAGNAQSQFDLGLAYDLGQGVAQDEKEACKWYHASGDRGVVAAQFNMAVMYDAGRCGPRNATEAATWYGRAAASGNPRAEYNLAQMYSTGDGVPRNPDQAAGWYQLALRHGVSAAAEALRSVQRTGPKATSAGVLHRAVLSSPTGRIPLVTGATSTQTAFVWQAPDQPTQSKFFLEVSMIDDAGQHEVFAHYVTQSAALVTLIAQPAHYLWRVYVISDTTRDYVVSDPCEFDVGGSPA